MTYLDLALAAAVIVLVWIVISLFGCTVAAVSVDCPIATDATGEAGAQP
jgi:hypothetical protein